MPGASSSDPGIFVPGPFLIMKPVTQITGALAIAILFGSGGYFLGKSHTSASPSSGQMREASGPAAHSPEESRKPESRPLDPKSLRAALDAEKNPITRFKLAMQNMEAWVAKDPQGALAWLASQQPTERRDEVMRMALKQYAEIDAKGAAAWAMTNLNGIDLNNTLISIAEDWAEQNGAEAAAWFLALPVTEERNAAMENLMFAWASNEPSAALEFLKANPNLADLSPTLRRAALAGWVKTDPEGAVNESLTLSRANNDPEQFANTLANWATMDLEASSQWLLKNLPAGAERTVAAQEIATIFANQSPDAGIAWIGKLDAGPERDAAASTLATDWSRSGPADAAKWAASQTSATLSPESIAEISRNFLMKDSAGFEAWRASLPPGPIKDQAAKVVGPSAGE